MPRVNVESCAWVDPRFPMLGRALGIPQSWWTFAAIGVMARIWSVCTERGVDCLPVDELAILLDIAEDQVADILCDKARLGELLSDGTVRIRGCEGRTDWLEELRATAKAGGDVRAATADRDTAGRFLARQPERGPDGTFVSRPGDLATDILATIASGPTTRTELRRRVKARKKTVLRVVRDLLASGQLIVDGDGRLALSAQERLAVDTQPRESGDCRTDALGDHGSVDRGSAGPAVPSAPASARAPAPARVPARERDARAHAMIANPPSQACEPEPWTEERLKRANERAPEHERRLVARALWAYQNRRRKHLDPQTPDIPLVEIPGGSLDAVLLALATYTPAQCTHALDMFAVEAACKRDAGEDALEFLNGRTNWKSEQLARAVASTAEGIRKRFVARSRKNAAPPVQKNPLERIA